MIEAFGWIVLQTLQDGASNVEDDNYLEILEDIRKKDTALWDKFKLYLQQYLKKYLFSTINFTRNLNNISGLVNFAISRNHKAKEMYELLNWVVENGVGSYGIVHYSALITDLKVQSRKR